MEVFPELHTPRLHLRKLQVEDFPSLILYANNRKISDQILNLPHPFQEPNAVFRISYVVQGFKNKTRYAFAIVLRARDELIGEISLHLEEGNKAQLAYWIGEPFWGRGIATEAARAVLKFGFEQLTLDLVYATCHVENKASEKVLLNTGMKWNGFAGTLVQYSRSKQDSEEDSGRFS